MRDSDKVLRVAEAKTKDVGRGIARIDPAVLDALDLEEGDTIAIEGTRQTVAVVAAPYAEDGNRGLIRIDGSVRRNAGVGIDDKVGIRKVDPKPARKLVLAPTEPLRIMGGEEYLAQMLDGRVLTRGDIVQITVSEKVAKEEELKIPRVTYEDLGGLRDEVRKVREMIELPLRHPELFERLGVEAPKGVLLHGPPGTGKTLLARAVASETQANFTAISGPEVVSKFYGQSEENLREIFKQAQENAPSIVFIDEIDSIAPKRDEVTGEVERRIVAQLLSLMDGLNPRGKVVVIGATNRPNSLDPALRRPGRFDREVEIGIPDRDGRLEILQIHTRGMPLAPDVVLEELAGITHGYVGADLAALAKEAALRALRRVLPDIDLEVDQLPVDVLNRLVVTREDFLQAYREMEPSTMREVLIEKPNVRWGEIGGLEDVKQALRETVEWPLQYGPVFAQVGAKPPKGILLYGPPGTGKTLLAKAVATEAEANFIAVKGPEFFSKWVGESERAVRETFRKAKQAAPCIVFFDEIDAIAASRGGGAMDTGVGERVISQLLTELDGLEELNNVTVIAATNRPDLVDAALLRPGRFDRLLAIPTPDLAARKQIFQIHAKGKPLTKDVDLDEFARRADGMSGADIAGICNEAAMLSIREYVTQGGSLDEKDVKRLAIGKRHFDRAFELAKARSEEKGRGPSPMVA